MLKIAGTIPVTIYPFFWILAAVIGWLNTNTVQGTAVWTVVILISVLVHEFGHALTALFFGQKAKIDLMGFGGLTTRKGKSIKKWQEFIIVMNGPIAGFILAGIAYRLQLYLRTSYPDHLITYGTVVAFYVNVFWTIVNLFPVQPMDGGKLLSIILEKMFGSYGLMISHSISLILATGLGIFFIIIGSYLAGSLFFIFAYESYNSLKGSRAIQDQDLDADIINQFKEIDQYVANRPLSMTEERNDAWARTGLQTLRDKTKKGITFTKATEILALLEAEQGQVGEAYQMLNQEKSRLNPVALCFLQSLAFELKMWDDVIAIGDKAYQQMPNYQTALISAKACAMLSKTEASIGWLKCALKEGIPHLSVVLQSNEFDAIRKEPLFIELSESINKGK